MVKHFGQLSHHWSGSFKQVQNWLCSRKYNGWSVLWDGGFTRGMTATDVPWYYRGKDKPISATGLWSLGRDNKPKVIHAPDYFLDKLPKGIPTHGELWYNDRLDVIKSTCGNKKYFKPMWLNVKYKVFNSKPFHLWNDTKDILPKEEPLPARYDKMINELKKYENDTFHVIDVFYIRSQEDIKMMMKKAKDEKWEGLMFANPSGSYEAHRSYNNLKWKQVYETEALVIGYEEGKTGRNIGQVGAIQATLQWDDKVLSIYGGLPRHVGEEVDFCVSGLRDDERSWDECRKLYKIGTRVRVSYSGVSIHGVPQSPNIYRGK